MINEPPAHLAEKYRVYAIWFEKDNYSKPNGNMIMVHIGRPISLATLCDTYIFQHMELTVERTGQKIKTNTINGIQKIENNNKPDFELAMDGTLKSIE